MTFKWHKKRTGQWVCLTGLALSLAIGSASDVSASEQKPWVARTVEMVKKDIESSKNSTHYEIKWGDTLSVIAEAVKIDVNVLGQINKISNINLIYAGNSLYISKDGQRIVVNNGTTAQAYQVIETPQTDNTPVVDTYVEQVATFESDDTEAINDFISQSEASSEGEELSEVLPQQDTTIPTKNSVQNNPNLSQDTPTVPAPPSGTIDTDVPTVPAPPSGTIDTDVPTVPAPPSDPSDTDIPAVPTPPSDTKLTTPTIPTTPVVPSDSEAVSQPLNELIDDDMSVLVVPSKKEAVLSEVGQETDLPLGQTEANKTVKEVKTTEELPYEVIYEADETLKVGESKVVEEGVIGQRVAVEKITVVDGKEEERETILTDDKTPVNRVVKVGVGNTKEQDKPSPSAPSSDADLTTPVTIVETYTTEIIESSNKTVITDQKELIELARDSKTTLAIATELKPEKLSTVKLIEIYDNNLLEGQRHLESIQATYVTAVVKRRREEEGKEDKVETLLSKDIPVFETRVRVGTKKAYAVSGYVYNSENISLEETKIQVILDDKLIDEIETDVEGYTYSHFEPNKTYTLKTNGFEAKVMTNEKSEATVENVVGKFSLGKHEKDEAVDVKFGSHVLFFEYGNYQTLKDDGQEVEVSGQLNVKPGDVIVIPPHTNYEGAKAIKVKEILIADGMSKITYEKPTVFEVIDNLLVENLNAEVSKAIFRPAPGVKVIQQENQSLDRSFELSRSRTITLDFKDIDLIKARIHDSKISKPSVEYEVKKFNGSLSLTIGGGITFERVALNKRNPDDLTLIIEPYIELDSKVNLSMGGNEEVLIPLGDLENLLPFAARVNVDLPLYIKLAANGEFNLVFGFNPDIRGKYKLEGWNIEKIKEPKEPATNIQASIKGDIKKGFSLQPEIELLETVNVGKFEFYGGLAVEGEAKLSFDSKTKKLSDIGKAKLEGYTFFESTFTLDVLDFLDKSSEKSKKIGKKIKNSGVKGAKYNFELMNAKWYFTKPNEESDFLWEDYEDGVSIYKYVGTRKNVVIPEKLGGKKVRRIAVSENHDYEHIKQQIDDIAAQGRDILDLTAGVHYKPTAFPSQGITSVVIPNTVTEIGDWAFASNKLKDIEIPNSVVHIGANAFYENELSQLRIPDSVKSIGSLAFNENKLTSIKLSNSLEKIGYAAFADNQLEKLILPDSIKELGGSVFSDNYLTDVKLPNSIKEIPHYGFAHNKLESIIIPDSVKKIENQAFIYNNLTSAEIPDSVEEIALWSFDYSAYKTILLPKHFKSNYDWYKNGWQLERYHGISLKYKP